MTLFARLTLGGVFLVSGLSKSFGGGRQSFRRALAGFGVPVRARPAMGFAMPALEVTAGAFLIAGLAIKATAVTLGVLLILFGAATVRVLIRGERVDCGCFGVGAKSRVGLATVIRQALLLALALVVVV